MDMSYLKPAYDAFRDASQIGSESAIDALKIAPFQFVESALTDLALKGAPDNIPDRNSKKWDQSFSFTDVFTPGHLNLLTFYAPPQSSSVKKAKNKPANFKNPRR